MLVWKPHFPWPFIVHWSKSDCEPNLKIGDLAFLSILVFCFCPSNILSLAQTLLPLLHIFCLAMLPGCCFAFLESNNQITVYDNNHNNYLYSLIFSYPSPYKQTDFSSVYSSETSQTRDREKGTPWGKKKKRVQREERRVGSGQYRRGPSRTRLRWKCKLSEEGVEVEAEVVMLWTPLTHHIQISW